MESDYELERHSPATSSRFIWRGRRRCALSFLRFRCRCPCGVHPQALFVTSNRSTNRTGAAYVRGYQEVHRAKTGTKAKVSRWFGTVSLALLLSSRRAWFFREKSEEEKVASPFSPLFLVSADIFVVSHERRVWREWGARGYYGVPLFFCPASKCRSIPDAEDGSIALRSSLSLHKQD